MPCCISRGWFFCPFCHHTCSALPACMAPRRWYLWEEQEQCLKARFRGCSISAIARLFLPSRQTVNRWLQWALGRFNEFRSELQVRFPSLGYENQAPGWWSKLLEKIKLSTAMAILHGIGINVLRSLGAKHGEPAFDSS